VTIREAVRLIVLAALWGGSFFLMAVAAPRFGPVVLVELRMAIAAAVLLPLVVGGGRGRALWTHGRSLAVVGVMNSALPFSLLAYATVHLTGGFVSILNGTTPFFAAIIAFAWLGARLSRVRVFGLFVGFAGVVLLVWGRVSFRGTGAAGWPVLATLAAAACYGFSASYTKRRLTGVDARTISAGSMFWGALLLLPVALFTLPRAVPSAGAWGAVVLLGVFSTGVAYLLYFGLLAKVGPTAAVTVTFLVPAFAMLWGGLFRGEVVTGRMIVGTAVILVGTGLTTGLLRPEWVVPRRVTNNEGTEPRAS
jgi:drug/metabolite transporter (DMT)-like permease